MPFDSEPTLAALTKEYAAWNKANGLNLGSADEHLHDDNLTEAQRSWLARFSARWEHVARIESDNVKVTNDVFLYVWGPYDWTIIGPFLSRTVATIWAEERFAGLPCEFLAARACKPTDYPARLSRPT